MYSLLILGVCVFVAVSSFVFGWHHGLWRLQKHASRLQAGCKLCEWWFFIMENGGLALKQRESIHFGDFWHIQDDFAIKNATKTISKA
jgi:hypothetical protein